MRLDDLPPCWKAALRDETENSRFAELRSFVADERQRHEVFPTEADVFNALKLTPLDSVRVLILGQDPYHDVGQAHGLSFSVQRGTKIPPSLRNIFKELADDLNILPPTHGCLESWAQQGVLLLNTVLTVRAHEANSHQQKGWEAFTDRVLQSVNDRPSVVFVLWGKAAQQKESLICSRHCVIKTAHPSPLSARRGFLGSKPFSRANEFLSQKGMPVIDWELPR